MEYEIITEYNGILPITMCKKDKTVGFQFHPENGGISGLKLLGEIIKDLTT